MAPFPIIESQPQIKEREASPDQITLSITHASTTYTTTIALGASTAIANDATAVTTLVTTDVISAPTQTAQVTPTDSSSGSNTGVVVGAVLGSVLGTLVLLTVLYKCCFDNRSAAWIPTYRTYYDSDTDSERSSRSSRVHGRGGGDGFGTDNRRGDRIRRPRRARTRRHGREESGSRSEWSYGTRSSRRRRSGMNNNDGLLGWFLVPRTTPYRHSSRYSEKHRRSSWVGRGPMNTADD